MRPRLVDGDNSQVPAAVGSGHCMITVSDWEPWNAFYRDVLGAEPIAIDTGRFASRLGERHRTQSLRELISYET